MEQRHHYMPPNATHQQMLNQQHAAVAALSAAGFANTHSAQFGVPFTNDNFSARKFYIHAKVMF
jgi:hypothetical protein